MEQSLTNISTKNYYQVSKVTADFMCLLFGITYFFWKELLFKKCPYSYPLKVKDIRLATPTNGKKNC